MLIRRNLSERMTAKIMSKQLFSLRKAAAILRHAQDKFL